MAEINWTAEAEQWLKDIHDYIAQDNPEAASRVINTIYAKVQLLKRFPELGYKYELQQKHNIRVLLLGRYRIAYIVKKDGNIDILGVFHGALDIDHYQF